MSLTKATYSMISGAVANVFDFGALGNGIHDDTAAINAAIAFVSTGTYGGGEVFFPKGNYLTTSTIYLPQSVTLIGTGRRVGGYSLATPEIDGSTIIGKHTGAAIISCKGSAFDSLQNLGLWGDQTTSPKTGLCLGRTSGAGSAGRHYFENIVVAGYFSQAVIYSIASEENSLVSVHGLLLGGGAKYCFYTSNQDDLSVDTLTTGSNWPANTIVGFNFLNQATANDSCAIYIKVSAGTQGWTFRDGFTGMTSGTNSSHIWLHVTEDTIYSRDFVFDCVGSESVSNAAPPVQHYRVTSSLACTLRGLVICNCTPGQNLGGTSYYLNSADNIILDSLFLQESIPDHPSTVWRLTNSYVNTPSQNLTVRSGALNSNLNAREIISDGVLGQVVKTLCLSPIYGPVIFTGSGTNAMTVSTTTLFTGTTQINLVVQIDGTPTPNTFKWSINGGSTWVATGVSITAGTPQLLQSGIYVLFSQGTGLTIGNNWACTFDPVLLPTQSH